MLKTATTSKSSSFLDGGGELGELIRSYDWSKTSLGTPDTWPQSLKTCVRIMLTSRQPIWIGWGKELIKLYNDPYKAIVGGKHPWALGQPASVVWKDIWMDIEPMLKTVMEKDEGTYVESQLLIMVRNGYPEETYYTFSYTPIPGDKGGTAGMICANTDDTERILNERQLRTLRDLGKTLAGLQSVNEVYEKTMSVLEANSKDFPFGILYKIDNEGRTAESVAYAGIDKDQVILPATINLLQPSRDTYNFCDAFEKKEIIVCENKSRRKNIPKGAWEIEATHFINIPVINSRSGHPSAMIVAGLNPYRIFNESFRQFTTLIADQVALEVNNVLAFEEERKRAEALAEIDKAKTIFFSNISHEFRTPLTLMLGPLEELMNRPKNQLGEDERQKIETTHRNAIRLLRLVNNLLDFSRIEAGRVRAQFQLTDIARFTTDLASGFRSVIESAGLKFRVNCEYIVQPVYIDKSMWEKIVLNLLSNAFKYTLNGSISISLSTNNGIAELKVKDTGVGIPEEELPRMFERFHRVQNVSGRTYEGTGIGLSLVNELVKLHGGNVSVTSQVGKGSEFTVSIPIGRKHLPQDQLLEADQHFDARLSDTFIEEADLFLGDSPVHHNGEQPKRGNVPTVLIVDDNADMRKYLSTILSDHYNIVTASNGMDALHKLETNIPALVLTDVMMPIMDGIQLLKTIKEDKKYAGIPVILLTARAGEESRIEGYETGADDYLVKPFSSKELLARISAQLATRKKIEEYGRQLEYFIKEAPVGIIVYRGREFIVDVANEKALEMWGKTLEEVKGKKIKDIFPEVYADEKIQVLYDASVWKFLQGESFVVTEAEITFNRNGKSYTGWYNYTHEPVRDIDGNITGILAVANEVTEQVLARKKIEENEAILRKTKEQLELSINAGGIGIWLWDVKNNSMTWSKEQMEMFGVLPGEFKGGAEDFFDSIVFDDKAKVYAATKLDFEKSGNQYEFRIKRKDGATRWIQSKSRAFFGQDGKPRYITGVNIDITEQKEAEEKLKFAATLTDSIADAVIACETAENNYRITSWNDGAEQIYGWKAEEVIGRPTSDVLQTVSLIDSGREDRWKQIVTKGHWREEAIQKHKDGRSIVIQATLSVVRDKKGKEIGVVAVNRDITDQKKVEEAYKNAKEQLELTFKNIPSGVYQFNSKGKLEYINKWGAELMGYGSVEEVLAEPDMEQLRRHMYETFIVLDESGNAFPVEKGSTSQAFSTGLRSETISQFIHKQTGEIFWILSNSTPLYNEDGELSFVLTTATDITVQKIAEQRIRESEQLLKHSNEQLEHTFKNIPAGVFLLNRNGEMIFVNDIAAEMCGYASAGEMMKVGDPFIIGEHIHETFDLFDEDGLPLPGENTPSSKTLKTGKPAEAVIKVVNKKDGYYYWVLSRSSPLFDEQGAFSRVLIISAYVTQQKVAEQRIKLNEEKFRDLSITLEEEVKQRIAELTEKNRQLIEAQQIANLGSWEWDVVTNELTWSDNLYRIYDIDSPDPVTYDKFRSLLHPADRGYVEKIIESSLKEKRFQEFYHRIITPAGAVKTLHSRGEVIADDKGNIMKLVGTAQDVTAQKIIEDKLIDTNEKLEQRNVFVEKLINSSPDLIMVIDKKLRFITLNKKAESVIQPHFSGKLIGKKITEVNPFAEKTEAFQDLMSAFKGEIIIRNRVKSTISDNYYEHNYIPLVDPSGNVYAVMVISHDITENIRQIDELKKLSESDQLKSDFIKMASHELKTPVTSAKGYVQLLLTALQKDQDKPLSPSLMKLSLVSIDKQITRLTRLLSELLDLSKIETGKLELSNEVFNLNEMVIDTVQDILYSHSKHNINIFHDFGANVFADKDRIGQVLINFLTNAIKYSPDSSKIEVWIKQAGNDSVSVSVKDYGIGIDKRHHDKIFDRFYRVEGKEEQTYPGFGIGLFIAKEIIQQHGGSIDFTSEKGKGSVFTFTLRIAG